MNISAREESLGSEDPSISPNSLRFRATLARGHPRVVAKNAKLRRALGSHSSDLRDVNDDLFRRCGQTVCTAIIDLFARSCGGWHVVKVARTKYGSSPYCRCVSLSKKGSRSATGEETLGIVTGDKATCRGASPLQRTPSCFSTHPQSCSIYNNTDAQMAGIKQILFKIKGAAKKAAAKVKGLAGSVVTRSSTAHVVPAPTGPPPPSPNLTRIPKRRGFAGVHCPAPDSLTYQRCLMYPTRPTSDLDCAKARKPTTTHYRQGGCDTDRINSGADNAPRCVTEQAQQEGRITASRTTSTAVESETPTKLGERGQSGAGAERLDELRGRRAG
ncbi:hypothetical protein DFH06DRAFT_1150348 [Mycena polygramma]|nr:hypothetical protein DFH06DRAFT_1150348 [Mycena polygramma]